jgi:hypothetical protein
LLDPYKRVHHFDGLVLGVDEFKQDQLYFMERDRLHNRALHGYGTVCGLKVEIRERNGPEVFVAPGLALAPSGQMIRVPTAQCAKLEPGLDANRDEIYRRECSPPSTDSLRPYVVLCYRECKTDVVPVPSGPCGSQDDTMTSSRIADAFELKLSLDRPPQVEEEAVRLFGELLRRIEISDAASTYLTQLEIEHHVRDLAKAVKPDSLSPPEFSSLLTSSPPEGGPIWYLRPEEAHDLLRAAFRVWVTEVRCHFLEDVQDCSSCTPDHSCVLLAELEFGVVEVGNTLKVVGGASDVSVNEDNRPVLLHTRLLQEW